MHFNKYSKSVRTLRTVYTVAKCANCAETAVGSKNQEIFPPVLENLPNLFVDSKNTIIPHYQYVILFLLHSN